MANEKNLLPPFPPGRSGNPAGRPKGSPNRSTLARKWLAAVTPAGNPLSGDIERLSQEDIITLAQVRKASAGDTAAYNALMDSAYGKPVQEIEQVRRIITLTDELDGPQVEEVPQLEEPACDSGDEGGADDEGGC